MDQQRVNAARVWMTRIRVSAAAPRDPAHGWVGGTISRVPQESMRGRADEYKSAVHGSPADPFKL
jgi:hypothetical protein